MTKVRFYNCYHCAAKVAHDKIIRKPKSENGEILIWCGRCVRRDKKKKEKLGLIKRNVSCLRD